MFYTIQFNCGNILVFVSFLKSCDSVAVALTVCHCWNVILGAKLQPESQRELRKWHTKV